MVNTWESDRSAAAYRYGGSSQDLQGGKLITTTMLRRVTEHQPAEDQKAI